MKNKPMYFGINHQKELNSYDNPYLLNSDVAFNGVNGKITLSKGTKVNFVANGYNDKVALISHPSVGIVDISIYFLSASYQTIIGRVVTLKENVTLNTSKGSTVFEKKVSKFLVENVFEIQNFNTRNIEKRCFVRYLRDGKYATETVGDIYFYDIDEVK